MDKERKEPCLIHREYVNTFFKKRDRGVHKGNCGKVLIIAGSLGMAGAAMLCARGALRAGAGLVRVSVPEELFPVIQIGVPEATCVSRRLGAAELSDYDAIAIGPGLGKGDDNGLLMENVIRYAKGTVVIDADGLNYLARSKRTLPLSGYEPMFIITPHAGEAGRLLSLSAAEVNWDREGAVQRLAGERNAVAVLKGAGTLVATPEGSTYINTTGNPGMATGGSGDVLAGVIAALAGGGLTPLEAATSGVYLHGLAGDLGAARFGEYGLIASDIAALTAQAIAETLSDQLPE